MNRTEAERLDQIEQRLDGVLMALTATVDTLVELRDGQAERTDRMLTLLERLTGAPSRPRHQPQVTGKARHLRAVE